MSAEHQQHPHNQSRHVLNCSIPYTDIKPLIVKYILKRWQDSWDQQIHNKLHEMHSLVGKIPCSCGQNRINKRNIKKIKTIHLEHVI
jgi:hypothetical protein